MEQASKEAVKQAAAARSPWYRRGIKTLGDIFVPIIPAIVASGFLMGLMEALNFMAANGFVQLDTSGSLFVFAKLFSNTAYVFLPVLNCFFGRQGVWGQPFPGGGHRHELINPPRPAKRLDRLLRRGGDAAGVRRSVRGAAGGLPGACDPGR